MNPIIAIEISLSVRTGIETITIYRKDGFKKTFWKHLFPMYRNLINHTKNCAKEFFATPNFVYINYWTGEYINEGRQNLYQRKMGRNS